MSFIVPSAKDVVRLKLARDHMRHIKQGFPWIYRDWLAEVPKAPAGTRALVRDKEGQLFAFGMYDPESPIAVRVCALEKEQLGDELILSRLAAARDLRSRALNTLTNGFRLINGEGDGLPGLVCDVYDKHAVLKLDGDGPSGFWNIQEIAHWLSKQAGYQVVYQKPRPDSSQQGKVILGTLKETRVPFVENGLKFEADIIHGQKSGFFFDQRDNRLRFGRLAQARTVLNLFGYTGGFSVYAGMAGARSVTTVDLAKPAIEWAKSNWTLNKLPENAHEAIAQDAFEFLDAAKQASRLWDLIVVDPPSFAPAERHVERAKESYQNLFIAALHVLSPGGTIAFSSCSSHIPGDMFLEICKTAVSKTRRRAKVIGSFGQPEDHPYPLVCPELCYLKFVLLSC
ncbi:MAG: class I SAM-dependent rRNA methyltransferase [Oligoflexia bacterium]|nr:class I SAM-dependent rRNA methyltransferase [Oligoflexia bacterium]